MRKVGILTKLNYQAGLLSDMETTKEVVATPEEQVEIITNGAENIVPEEVSETESLLNEIVAEDEIIEDELAEVQEEQEVVAEGLQSDFTAVTTRTMVKSIERLNKRYGKDAIVTSGMQSDKFGGHKALYVAGLQAKESFLKDAAKNVWALIQSMIQKIKEMATKVSVWLNNDKKSADKLLKIIKGKNNSLKKGVEAKLTDKEKEAIGNKFGAWLSIDGKLEDYPSVMVSFLMSPIETILNSETDEVEIIDNEKSMSIKFKINKDVKAVEGEIGAVSCVGKNLKYVVIGNEGNTSIATTAVQDDAFKAKLISDVPSLGLLEKHAAAASKLAEQLKTYSKGTFAAMDTLAKMTKEAGAEEKYSTVKKAIMIQNQIAMSGIAAYTATQKTMIWFAGAFVNKYEGVDAKPEDKQTTEEKK